jgi:hypothetical protein
MADDYALYRAIYKDPATNKVTVVEQTELKAQGKSYEDLDRSDNLIQFQLVKPDGSIIFSVPFKEGQGRQLIWRRRVQNHSDGSQVTFYLVGKKGAFVACLMPDYTMIIDNNYNEDNAVLSSVTPVRGEEGYSEDNN